MSKIYRLKLRNLSMFILFFNLVLLLLSPVFNRPSFWPLPDPHSGQAPTNEQLDKLFSNHLAQKLFPIPTINDIQNSPWSKQAFELPRPEATNKEWYFTQMWKPEDSDYDFQLQRFYYEQLKLLLAPGSEFNNLIYPYIFELDSDLVEFIEWHKEFKEIPTNIVLDISDRSVYGLTINSITFDFKCKILGVFDDYKKSSFEFHFKPSIKIEKEIFITETDGFIWPWELIINKEPSNFSFNTVTSSAHTKEISPPRIAFDSVYSVPGHERSGFLIFPFDNNDFFNFSLLNHFFDKHNCHWDDEQENSFDVKPALSFSYLFIGNLYTTEDQFDGNYISSGIYLVTSLNCEHNQNGELTRK
jgi:hypothetical protein